MKQSIRTAFAVTLSLFTIFTFSSCMKSATLSSVISPKQVTDLLDKYHFQKNIGFNTEGTIQLTANSLADFEAQLATIDQVRRTPQQIYAIQESLIKEIHTSKINITNAGTPLDIFTKTTFVSLSSNLGASVLAATCQVKFAFFPINFNNITNLWNVSGLIPGSSKDVTGDPRIIIIGTGTDPNVAACSRTWLFKVTVNITGPITLPVGYVVRCVGYFNVGLDIPNYTGHITIT